MNARWGFHTLLACLVAAATVVPVVTGAAAADDEIRRWQVPAVWAEPVDGATVAVAGHDEHRGSIEVRPHQGSLATIAHLRLEDYVAGVAEVPSRWPQAALEAQAIAARTFALNEMSRTVGPAWREVADTCASESCQVYVGTEKERASHGERWVAAAQRTAGYVLLWEGQPIRAKYSSSNGGWSVPGGRPYLPSVEDPHDVYSPQHRWRAVIPTDQVAAAFELPAPPTHAGKSGNLVALYHAGEAADEVREHRVDVHDFRTTMNVTVPPPPDLPRPVPSVRFEVWIEDDTLVVEGVGFGHGIGMSQWGAYGKAVHGWSSPQILAAYYGGLAPVRWEQAPEVIRVALAHGPGTATISGGPFRLVSGDGTVLATRATGTWTVAMSGSGVVVAAGGDATAELPEQDPASFEAAAVDIDREPIEPPAPTPFEIPSASESAPRLPEPARGLRPLEMGAAAALLAFTTGAIVVITRGGPLSLRARRRR